jgi:predicted RNA-binding protein with TRAM domain
MIEFTEWATDILSRSDAAARRFNPDARVRVIRDGDEVRFELTDAAEPGDQIVEREGFTLYVEAGLEGVVDVVEPHDRLILRPPGSTERSVRGDH